jgi:hypothetical protein
LDGREVTTHWRFSSDVARRFPKLRVDCGRQIALKLAREFVVHLKRSGEQEQYSEALQFQVQSCDRFADISAWILCNLVLPHLRRRNRGCENACYHATKENEFSPVHSVIGFQRLKPPGFKSCGTGKGKKVTTALQLHHRSNDCGNQ